MGEHQRWASSPRMPWPKTILHDGQMLPSRPTQSRSSKPGQQLLGLQGWVSVITSRKIALTDAQRWHYCGEELRILLVNPTSEISQR